MKSALRMYRLTRGAHTAVARQRHGNGERSMKGGEGRAWRRNSSLKAAPCTLNRNTRSMTRIKNPTQGEHTFNDNDQRPTEVNG